MAKKNAQVEVEETELEGAEGDDAGTDTAVDTETKTKYETMVVGVSKARKPLKAALDKLGGSLGCKATDLIWFAIDAMLKNPPKAAPAGASTNVGTAAGFWTVPVVNSKGRAEAIKIVEVDARGDVNNGRTFFRFKKGDSKERNRSKSQAIRSAQNDAQMIGFKDDIEIEELEGAAA